MSVLNSKQFCYLSCSEGLLNSVELYWIGGDLEGLDLICLVFHPKLRIFDLLLFIIAEFVYHETDNTHHVANIIFINSRIVHLTWNVVKFNSHIRLICQSLDMLKKARIDPFWFFYRLGSMHPKLINFLFNGSDDPVHEIFVLFMIEDLDFVDFVVKTNMHVILVLHSDFFCLL